MINEIEPMKEAITSLENDGSQHNLSIRSEVIQLLGTRENQQDTIDWIENEHEFMAVLADGIGGMEKGEIASSLAVNEVMLSWEMRGNDNFQVEAYQNADEIVRKMVKEEGLTNAGSTLASVYIKDHLLYLCSVGDSYIFLFRDQELIRLNTSHNYELFLNQMLEHEKITIEEYQANLYKKSMLISYIGKGDLSLMDYNKKPIELFKHDVLLICSDGLFSAISQEELAQVIKKNANPATINKTLVNMIQIKKSKNQDNTSVITIYIRQ